MLQMTRTLNKLSAQFVMKKDHMKGTYPDGGGLYLKVTESSTKSWLYRFSLNKKPRWMGLGAFPAITLSDAREKAGQCRKLVKSGIDPIALREDEVLKRKAEQSNKVMSFKDCAEAYLNFRGISWKNAKHRAQWPSTLKQYVYPVFGDTPIDQVNIHMVMEVLEPIWWSKTETASRIRGRIESILDYAVTMELRAAGNPARWKGRLANVLPSPAKVSKVKHHPALSFDDLPDFMLQLKARDAVSAKGLEFLILTATRTSEVIGAEWSEIDIDNAVWTIPPLRMKNEREHKVPLSADAVNVLKQMNQHKNSDYVFPGPGDKRPLSNMAFLQLLKRMGRSDITAHGFRSTFRDWISEQTSYPNEVAEMALAHTIPNKAEAAYRRGDLFEKRKRLMNDWAIFSSMETGHRENVVGIGT